MTSLQDSIQQVQAEFEERLQKVAESFMQREFELQRGHQNELKQVQLAMDALRMKLDNVELEKENGNGRGSGSIETSAGIDPPVPPIHPSESVAFNYPLPSTPKRPSRKATAKTTPSGPGNSTPPRSSRRVPPPSTPRRKATPVGPRETATPSKPQRPKRNQYQLTSQELKDPFIDKARVVMNLHIRLLGSLDTAASVPQEPSKEALVAFYRHFANKTESELAEQLRSGPELILEKLVNVTSYSAYTGRQKIRSALGNIEEHVIDHIRERLARFGFATWTPNYNESPYALYNSAARIAALDTLKQALMGHAYAFTGVDSLLLSKDMNVLIKVYDHVVHYYFHGLFKKHKEDPGSVLATVLQSPVYTSRNRLSASRIKFMKSLSFPERMLKICVPKATSDDEEEIDTNGRKVYMARARPERSTAAVSLVRWIDEQIEKMSAMNGRMRRNRRIRVIPQPGDQKPTRFPTLPRDMPIDYFDPLFFNSEVPLPLRPQIADQTRIAFAHDPSTTFVEASRLSDERIMDLFGEQVVGQYTFLDEGLRSDEDEEGSGGEWLQEDDGFAEDDDFEMELQEGEEGAAESVLDSDEEAEFVQHQRDKLAAEFAASDNVMEDI